MNPPHVSIADLCCGAGLAGDGYAAVFGARALHGFDIQPRPYPYAFTQADAIELLADDVHKPLVESFTAIHTSFPCQVFTTAGNLRTAQGGQAKWDDLLTPGLELLRTRWGHKPWIAENVDDNQGKVRALMDPRPGETLIRLCGSMFGLDVQRHRLFLANFPLRQPTAVPGGGKNRGLGCDHDLFPLDPVTNKPRPWGVYHVPGDSIPAGGRTARDAEHARQVMGVGSQRHTLAWDEVKEGFPPHYTTWIGADLRAYLAPTACGATGQGDLLATA